MGPYRNPFESQVVGQATQDIERTRQIQNAQNDAAASAAGAFGGGRHGIVEGETNRAALGQMADTSAQLRHRGFMDAAGLSNQDIQNRLAAAGGLASLAPQYGGLAQTGFQMGQNIMGQQAADADRIRGIADALMGHSAGMFDRYTGQPTDILRLRLGALGANPLNQESTTTTTQPTPKPTGLPQLAGSMMTAGKASDRRLKRDIRYLETLGNGIKLYSFRYVDNVVQWVGVMAQDLIGTEFDKAVQKSPLGYYVVDYGQLGIEMKRLEDYDGSTADTLSVA
jgi:hypothetical protein